MAVALEHFIKQLADSGIIAPGKLENFIPPKANPTSVDELVAELLKNNHLTQFQAAQVKAGKAKALILGEYTIVDKIGAGGMGQVFKAVHRRMDRTVAIKMLPPAMTKDAAALARFEREVRAAAKLSHPNIVAAYDAGQSGVAHFLVMEYVDGKDLSVTVKRDGPLPVNKAVNYILQAARGLEFAHGEGVVHRDIKPANLLLDKKVVVKILDMGLARIEQADGGVQSELTGTGTIMGTVDYMSPEQALNTRDADQRADIYSLGMSLYYLLAGKAAYSGDTVMQKLMAHQNQPIPSLQEVQTTVSKQLDAVFRKMVAKRIEDRYQSMSNVIEALEALGYGSSISGRKGDVASTLDLSSADRKKLLSQTKKKPLGSITEVVASEKSKNLILKIVGGSFGTIVAPILVFYLIRHLDKQEQSANPLAATAPAATVQPVAMATNTTSPTTSPVASGGNAPWNRPEFQAWIKGVQAMPAGQQVIAVNKKLVELNPGFDGKATPNLERGMVTGLDFITEHVTDISPVRALAGLQSLTCNAAQKGNARSALWELSPLEGMKLTKLECANTEVFDLSPLHGMPLEALNVTGTKVTDLSPLHGLPLTTLNMSSTKAADLSPLQGLPLASLMLVSTPVTDLSPLKGMSSLTTLSCQQCKQLADFLPLADCQALTLLKATTTKLTPAQVAALQKALPNCKIEWDGAEKGPGASGQGLVKPWNTPAFQQWVADTQALPAEQQIEAVSKKLMELNPGFDGKMTDAYGKGTPRIAKNVVTELRFATDNVTDISPVRALVGLKYLYCNGSGQGKGKLSDLSPLQGMPLTLLSCYDTQVSNLSPLQGSKLTNLNCNKTKVTDLSPLMQVKLTILDCSTTQVSDLSPVQRMPLDQLIFYNTLVSDLSPLHGMNMTGIALTPKNITKGLDLIRQLKSLKQIGIGWGDAERLPPDEFWKKYDAGEFGTPAVTTQPNQPWNTPAFQAWVKEVRAMPTEKQIEAVSKKLMELNPGFDGKVTPKIEKGVVTQLSFFSDNVVDISPVRALAGLMNLSCGGDRGKGKLSDLSPLQGMTLTYLAFANTQVSDLFPLRWMPLTTLVCGGSNISDLSPLETMPALAVLKIRHSKVTPAAVAALQKALPNCKIEWDGAEKGPGVGGQGLVKPWNTPAFQQWVKDTQALPAEQQIEAVRKKLMELNPGFDGKLTGANGLGSLRIVGGLVTQLGFLPDKVTDLSPVRALPGLRHLNCSSTYRRGRLADLSPLAGMQLSNLSCKDTQVADLSPLQGMPLLDLSCAVSKVADLSPLYDCRSLKQLHVGNTEVTAEGVAALQKVLPNCKIEWDDPTKPKTAKPPTSGTK